MSLAVISLLALVVALVLSCVSSVNIGFLAIVLAWIVGAIAGKSIAQMLTGFPVSLFLTLVGVTLLFGQAQVNGTLDRIAHPAIRFCRGNAGAVPVMFFVLTAILSSIGPGNVASTAIMAPIAMAAAGRYAIPPFLMAIMVANGASAGSVSPVAPTGIVVNRIAASIGLPDSAGTIYANNLVAHTVVAFTAYLLFGGWRLFARGLAAQREARSEAGAGEVVEMPVGGFEWRHTFTTLVIAAMIFCVVVLKFDVGMMALAGAMIVTLARAADEPAAVKQMPWNAIMMVSGVTTLVVLLQTTGGMDLFADLLARFATPRSATAVTAFVTGVVSIYSSTTGVVLPAFLPLIPRLVEQMGGGDPMALLSSMTVGGHLVDLSPVSTLGALCLAAAPPGTNTRTLFNQLLAWGVSMSVIGALVCWLVF